MKPLEYKKIFDNYNDYIRLIEILNNPNALFNKIYTSIIQSANEIRNLLKKYEFEERLDFINILTDRNNYKDMPEFLII